MKILIVAKLSSSSTNRQDDYLIMSLLERGVQLGVITNSVAHKEKYEKKGARVSLHTPASRFSPVSIRFIRKELIQQKPDILYLLTTKAVANGAMAAIGLPVKVVAYRGAAGFYWHDPTTYLGHFHPRVDVICCISNFIKQALMKNDLFRNRQYKVVHKGIGNEEEFMHPPAVEPELFNIPAADITIVCVANLRKVKGVHFLLAALQNLKPGINFRALMIGDKTDTAEFSKEIEELGLSGKVFGLGYKENIYSWIDTCDIYVQPSLQEGLGKSIMEAMLLGKPVIATRSGGPEELIENGKSGVIVPPKNSKAIARAVEDLVLHPEKRKTLGANARERMLTEFSLASYADKMYQLFEEVAAN